MIWMNWVQNDKGGFTAVQFKTSRMKLERFIRGEFIVQMQRIYRHEQFALGLFQALAAKSESPRREWFLGLAHREAAQMKRRADMLARWGARVPCAHETRLMRLWRLILVRCGARFALMWVRSVKRRDVRCQSELVRILHHLSG